MYKILLQSIASPLSGIVLSFLWWISKAERLHRQTPRLYIMAGLLLITLCNFASLTGFSSTAGIDWIEIIAGSLVGYIFIFVGFRANRSLLPHLSQNKGILKLQVDHSNLASSEANRELDRQLKKNQHVLEELNFSKQQFKTLLNFMPLPIFITDAEKKDILFYNDLLANLLGIEGDEIPKNFIWDVYESWQITEHVLNELHKKGYLSNYEAKLKKANGSSFDALLSIRVINYEGRPAWLFVINDVTERRRDITERQQVESEKQKFVSLVENSSEFIAMSSMEGNLLYINEAGRKLVGLDSLEEALSKSIADYFPADALAQFCEVTLPTLKTKGRCETESQLRHFKTGKLIDIHRSCFIVRHPQSDEPLCMATVQRDITERKQQEERLRLLERAIAASSNGIIITDVDQPDYPIVYVNPSFEQMTGYSAEEAMGKNCRFLQGNDREEPALDNLHAALKKGEDCSVVLRNYRKNGTLFWNELRISPVYNASGKLTHFIGVQTDITERKLMEERLLHNAFHDALTGLPNRALFMERLGQALTVNKRHQNGHSSRIDCYGQPQGNCPYRFAVLFLDIDGFKTINDSLGHRVGDLVLREFARRLETCLRAEDTLARLGGDEFTIILNGIEKVRDAVIVAERIHLQLAVPFHLDEHEVFITTSIGIVLSSADYNGSGELLRDADTAMYRAKAQGKSQHVVFDIVMHNTAVARLQMENDLRWAMENQEFVVVYQPIVSLLTGKLSGFEALVRWQHPEKGLIYPAEFLLIAEETGFCSVIDYWVLHEACRQMTIWQKQFSNGRGLNISVNLSCKQFWQADFIKRIDEIIQKTQLDTHSLKLEITETVIMKNPESVTQTLLQLKERNIHLSIDDFGTGYSSLSYLHNFPIKNLKIDRSFISRMGADDKNLQIVKAIVTLAHQLEIDVTAEGVETKEQLHQLKEWQCEYAQGYLFHKPMDSKAAENLIAAER